MALTKIKLGKDLLQAYFWYTKTYEGLKLARTKITILKLLKDLFSRLIRFVLSGSLWTTRCDFVIVIICYE